MGSVVNYVTKSGTNSIHGSAFYRYSGNFTSSLDTGVSKGATSASALRVKTHRRLHVPVVPRYVYNVYGGNLTAPLWKDKIFASGRRLRHPLLRERRRDLFGRKSCSDSRRPCDPNRRFSEQ